MTTRLLFIFCLLINGAAYAVEFKGVSDPFKLQQLPTSTTIAMTWELLYEAEHKSDAMVFSTSECATENDLVNTFPVDDKSGFYFSYLATHHQLKKSISTKIGSIDEIDIVEILHTFEQPRHYVKILSFKKQDLLCPFLVVSEWNQQLIYSQSYISNEQVISKFIDNIAHKSPSIVEYNFIFIGGLPRYRQETQSHNINK